MKSNALVLGGAGIGAVVLIAMVAKHGGQQTEGVAFASADPNSVIAAEAGVANEITANNALAVQRAKIASDTILGLAGTQAGLLGAQMNASERLAEARVNAQVSEQNSVVTSDAAVKIAQATSDATVAAAKAASDAAVQLGAQNLQATQIVANNQTTQAQAQAGAQKTSSFWDFLGNIGSSIIGKILPFKL